MIDDISGFEAATVLSTILMHFGKVKKWTIEKVRARSLVSWR